MLPQNTSSTPGVCTWSVPPPSPYWKVKKQRIVQMNEAAKNQDYTFKGEENQNHFCVAAPLCHTLDSSTPSAIIQAPATSTFHPPVADASQSAAAIADSAGVSGFESDLKVGAKNPRTTNDRVLSKNDGKKSSLSPGSGTVILLAAASFDLPI